MKKNIYLHEKNLDTAIDRYVYCTDIKQKTPLQDFCKGVFYFIRYVYQLRTLVLSRSA